MKRRPRARGMSYVEVLVIVAVVLTLGLLAIQLLGQSYDKQADREANCIRTMACRAGTPSGGGGGGISNIPTTPKAPETPPPPPAPDTSEHSYAVGKTKDATTDFKFVFAQYQRTPGDGFSGKAGFETLTKTGNNGRSFGFDIATGSVTQSGFHFNGSASALKVSYGQDVGKVPVKVIGNAFGGEANLGFGAGKKGVEAGGALGVDLASVEGQVGKLDPTKQGDIRGSLKVGVGLGAKLKVGISDDDADGYPELHISAGLGFGGKLEGNLVIETNQRTAPYVNGLLNFLGGKKK